jgi:hypothetical protein
MSNVTTPSAHPAATGTSSKSDSGGSSGSSSSTALSEDDLRKQLRSALLSLNRREPLEPTYKKLLERNTLTRKAATIPKNKFYKRIGSRLRERVEVYTREMQGKDPFDRISQRKPMDESGMRAAFTLREAKEHEQQPLLEATLATMAMHPERKRLLDGMALGLQTRNKKKPRTTMSHSPIFGNSAAAQTQMAKQRAELERQKNQARQWEEARMQRERDDRRKRVEEMEENRRISNYNNNNDGGGGSGSNALHQIIERVCKKYWDMEFPNLGGTNPFRIVIDRKSAPTIAPDYFNIITTPMNLTYVKDKTKGHKYTTLNQFFADIDLIIENALKYNVGEENPYRIASEDLKKKHTKIVKGVWKQIKEKQKLQNQS